MNSHLREPFRGLNLWTPRFVYITGLCAAFAFLYFKTLEIDVALMIMSSIYCIVFESIVHIYWARRAMVWSQGEKVDAIVLSKKTSKKSSQDLLVVEYAVDGEPIQAEGVVPTRLFFRIKEKDHLFIRVLNSKPKRWVLDGNDESYYL